ncbi:S8 family serine peptidase [Bacteriovorax sp. PP10]|uniref:S8 family serine peptidase n=1 Tax=Bacteriovorax antarcticus TaxID=3088717 RepID=A0ABU5VZ00_9BACT|nr:S8 family serine peptidase [Bacteriovorax sp. PP10]MEA9358301.1 S8 family serine peptidase [Bacteriovorax sp. PP10]
MKKLITLATLLQLGTASASVVAIMDSGTDINHKDLAPKAWTNKNEVVGSKTDLDGSGLPGDVHGWDFTTNSGNVFDGKYNNLLTPDVLKFYVLYAKYETKTITQAEFEWLKATTQDKVLMNKVNFVGGYAHGTHVGGVAALNNSKAEIMSLKILPTVYQELAPAAPADKANGKEPVQLELDFGDGNVNVAPAMSVEDFKKAIIGEATQQIQKMVPMHGYLKFHKVDVVNQSFGIGFTAAVDFISAAFIEEVKREPTQKELTDLVVAYFGTLLKVGPQMFAAAPDTLFIIAAGNDASNNDQFPDYPSSIQAPNKIVVAATLGYSEIADFSNFGATRVDVAAPGVAIQSTAPANNYVFMSGTSQAAPFVTNAIAQAKDINPALSASDLKSIILKTVDVKAWLKGKVSTSGIVNKARVNRAAELSKTMNVEVAIQKAKAEIADVVVPKTFAKRLPGMDLKFRPLRPSLLVKLPSL